jgi:hypothetical protein
LLALGSAALVLASGCGNSQGERFVPVAGKVRLDGELLTIGTVQYRPDASRGNTSMHVPIGTIQPDGSYKLETVGREGAPLGWYKVVVFADANASPKPGASRPLPPRWLTNVKYTDPKTTDLAREVVEEPAAEVYDLNVSK